MIGELIKNNLEGLKADLSSLLHKEPIKTAIDENVIFDPQLRDNGVAFWSVLLLSGYVKSVKKVKDEFGTQIHTLLFPNEEIRMSIRNLLVRVSFGQRDTYAMIDAMTKLTRGDTRPFVNFVKRYIRDSLSYFDGDNYEKEKTYHLLLLGMAAFFANTHHVRSNRESGEGRYDIGLEAKKKGMQSIIVELKVADEGEDLQEVAQKAYDQIEEKKYKTDMDARGVTDYVLLGMAFRGRDMEVVTND